MKKNNKKIYIVISILTVLIILPLISVFVYKTLKEEKQETTLYASVLESGKNYIKIKDENTDEIYYLNCDNEDLSGGEIIAITYKGKIENYKKIDVIVDNTDEIKIENPVITSTSTTSMTTTTSSKVITNSTISDETIVSMFEGNYMSVDGNNDSSIGENIKAKFIEVVDFIFYGTEIKGRTFASLSESAKGKVLYYALLLDQSIDNKWPDYKKNLSNKYQDVKAKLLAKYLDVSTEICSKGDNARYCEYVKSDFKVLKYSLNLTWDTIKKAFKFGYDKTTNALVKWYEMFSGKV